ncbi:hypothetical protein NDU88_006125 [Pleurodeles waltl]|uniref:Integrase p58-like C-terminal domain-containing protein n=1 Tax=Pleurodeles waltl TaxID=8319 RepID=A0AAV7WZV8_PLEWA|nr:hypothetical protein NDU88_006125 [Pleurodeles waltl]
MEYPGGTAGRSSADPEEAGVDEAWSCTNDTEHLRVLKPEQEKVQQETFSPGGKETRTENRTEGGLSTRNVGGGGRRGRDEPSITGAVRAEDDWEERRSGQAGHVLGRTWPSQGTKYKSKREFQLHKCTIKKTRGKLRKPKQLVPLLIDEVHKNLKEAQERQKTNYDTPSRPRELAIGQQILVLLLTTDNKLLAPWQGPYKILEKVTPVTYKIEIPTGSGRDQIYHINLLKVWHEPEEQTSNLYIST